MPGLIFKDLVAQNNTLLQLKRLGTNVSYPRPANNTNNHARIIVFSDAGRITDHRQLCHVAGILPNGLSNRSVFHTLSWSSHKSKRPVKSTGAAEILAAGEAIDEGKVLRFYLTPRSNFGLQSTAKTSTPLFLHCEILKTSLSALTSTSYALTSRQRPLTE